MAYTQENFQEWIFFISDKMEYFTGEFAKEHNLTLNYSIKSLDDLEKWILSNFKHYNDLIAKKELLDYLTIYIGETFRKHIGGKWFIDLKNKKNAYYSMPVLTDVISFIPTNTSSCKGHWCYKCLTYISFISKNRHTIICIFLIF